MNRSILIVICDFLLLSLLTFSTDINQMAGDTTQRSAKWDVTTNEVVQPGRDLAAFMSQALADERRTRDQLQQQLASARSAAGNQQQVLAQAERETSRLQAEKSQLQAQSAAWQQQAVAAQTNAETLTQRLQETEDKARTSSAKLVASQIEAQSAAATAAVLRQELDALGHSNQWSQSEQQRLANKLELADAERRAALDRANFIEQDLLATRAENARLAEGFKSLATNSSQLTREIRENRALAPNTLFNDFVTNRVEASIDASRTGFLGMDASKTKRTETMLVTDGTNTVALCHVDDTPLTLWDPGTDWQGLSGNLRGRFGPVDIHQITFHHGDPRVVMFPVSAEEGRQLGCKVYHLSADPYKFQDAVLVGATGGYYGECDFQIDVNTPQYVRLDRNLIKGLFGKFNPSRGDIVLSRTGELLGVMVNDTYCLMIHDFAAMATLAFKPNVQDQHTGGTLARLYDNVFQLPPRLQ